MACSFTKAAAVEIAERDVPLDKRMRGTLHSLCWRAFDRPPLAETRVDEFNEEYPHLRVSGVSASAVDEPPEGGSSGARGDRYLAQYNLNRATCLPREAWPESVLGFAAAWEDWKEQTALWDFTDLLERALTDLQAAPGSPAVIFVDEAQDLSRLQFKVIRRWGDRTEFFVLVGDDDQTIFSYAGADVSNMIGGDLPSEQIRVLKQSHRIPKSVHTLSQDWISKCAHRQPKEYLPRDEIGEVLRVPSDGRDPRAIVDLLEESETSMILGSCSYMLNDCIKEMRSRGMAFHNPYRRTRGDWNPMSDTENSTINRIRMFLNCGDELAPLWTMHQLNAWLDLVDAKGLLKHGAKGEIGALAAERPAHKDPSWRRWFAHGDPFGMDPVTIDWLVEHARASKIKAMEYPLRMIERHGRGQIVPKITVGTIHSVKGAEADTVVLLPDLSTQGWAEYQSGGAHRDNVIRTFYVGMTRAKRRLILPKASGPCGVRL